MKQLLISALALISFTTFAQTDFRKSTWGMSKSQVKQIEAVEPLTDVKDMLVCSSKLASLETLIGYIFVEGKLVRGIYQFGDKHTNRNDYIDDYKKLKELLTKKYGSPKKDDVVWKNDLYKGDVQNYGMAISIGHLSYYSSWTTDRTKIALFMYGENFEIDTALEYSSTELQDFAKKAEEEAVLDDF